MEKNATKIYRECSPSTLISKRLIENVKKITVSYGHIVETFYAPTVADYNNFFRVVLYTGETIELYKRFTVMVERCKLLEIVRDATKHSHHNMEGDSKVLVKYYYELKENEEYQYIEKDGGSDKSDISTIVERYN